MTPAEWAAYIGAAAWAPQIGSWLYGLWAKPIVRISPATMLGVSYNGAGPVISLTAALSTKRRDALIEKLEAHVTDERGTKTQLTWTFANDIQHQITVPTGEVLNFGRNQPATALSILTTSLVEKVIWFQDLPSMEMARKTATELMDHYDYLKKAQPENVLQQFRTSKEFMRAEEAFKAKMLWHDGKYELRIRAKEQTADWHEEKLVFELTKQDTDAMQGNLQFFEAQIQATIAQKEGYTAKFPTWKWVFAAVVRPE